MSSQKNIKSKTKHGNFNTKNNINNQNDDMEASISRYKGTILGLISPKNNKIDSLPQKNSKKELSTIQEKTNISDLESQLNNLNSKIIIEKQNCINEVSELNQKLSEAQKDISILTNNNSEFMNKLKKIHNIVNNRLKFAKIYQVKNEEIDNVEKEMKKNISIKEKEILIQNKNSKTIKKEIEKYQKLLSANDENQQLILNSELKELNEEIRSLQFEIRILKKILIEHKQCNIIKLNMITQKNILDSNYQFELKRKNMYLNNIENTTSLNQSQNLSSENCRIYKANSNNINEYNDLFKEYMKLSKNKNKNATKKNKAYLSVNQSYNSTKNNNNLSLNKKSKQKYKLNKLTLNRINKKLNLLNEDREKNTYQISNVINVSMDFNSNKPTYLFSKNEKEFLNQIIPENYLDAYIDRYNNLESQKIEIKEKFKENNDIKKEIMGKKEMIDFSTLQKKETSIITMSLKCKASKYKKIMMELNEKIKEINNQIKTENTKLAFKNRENKQLKQHLKEFQNKK